jgi:hypothetical protein
MTSAQFEALKTLALSKALAVIYLKNYPKNDPDWPALKSLLKTLNVESFHGIQLYPRHELKPGQLVQIADQFDRMKKKCFQADGEDIAVYLSFLLPLFDSHLERMKPQDPRRTALETVQSVLIAIYQYFDPDFEAMEDMEKGDRAFKEFI